MVRVTEHESPADVGQLEALARRLDAIDWDLPKPQNDLYLPPEQAWTASAPESKTDGDSTPATAA